ncbi:MAG TPA: YwmB family TATA-box binding protein [Acetivibrio sp.]|uniref:YwmB family TATA-box binding protein n=1 Tax=Acetivibrio sp. TaxID=1872092 RepID=UPI002CC76CDC|nr:YwmB family TATA-box binding protein [Acetivibrio sp.]HOM02821.1 YwmB family TATA-box binding protein [Acetivibrio sp.]
MKLSSKHFYLIIILIILFTIGYAKLYYNKGSSSTALKEAFIASGATLANTEFYAWTKTEKSFEELTKIIDSLAKDINVENNELFSRRLISNDRIDKIEIIGTIGKGKMINICAQSNRSEKDPEKAYISLSLTSGPDEFGLEDIHDDLINVFHKYKIESELNICMTGYFEGRMDYKDLNKISKKILKSAGAKKVNGIAENNLISVSAFAPGIDNSILVNGEKVNMNIAIRYNSYEDRTYIWLATPVITVEY